MVIPDFRSFRVRSWVLGLILVLCTVVVYQPARNGGFIWDDDDYVTKNALLTAPDGLRRIWFSLDSPSQYFPLVYTSFRIERALWGLNPTGYHWVNFLLHAANALLVWKLLSRLKVPGAWLAAMIFALHPVQVESVAWITERKNVLMGVFFLLTLIGWVAFTDEESKRRWRFYALALVTYALALSAKTTACTLPVAMLLILWLQKKPINRPRIFQVVPFFVLGLCMGLITLWWERYHVGTRGALFALDPLERLLVATRAAWFYFGKLLWPSDLTFIYPQWRIVVTDPVAYAWLLAGLGLGVAIYFARRLVGRSVEVATLFFVTTLGPLLGFIMLYTFRYTFVADHYQYLASIGPIALASAGLVQVGRRLKYGGHFVKATGFLIVAWLGVLTWRQSGMYSDIETLWRTTIARNPGCWMAYNNLGIALVERGEIDEAIAQYEKSLSLRSNYAQTHYNLGHAFFAKGKIDEAIAYSQKALSLEPNDADAHVVLGNAVLAKGLVDEAIAEYSTALKLRPNHSDAHYNLGNALLKKGEVDAAVAHFEAALKLQPDIPEAYLQLGNVFLERNRWREAIAHYEQALKLSPHSVSAQNSLAWALASSSDASLRDGPRAVQLAEQARQVLPREEPVILHTLAAAYAENRQFDKAIQTAQHALQLALREGESALTEDLRREIKLYQSGSPYQTP